MGKLYVLEFFFCLSKIDDILVQLGGSKSEQLQRNESIESFTKLALPDLSSEEVIYHRFYFLFLFNFNISISTGR